MAGFVNLTLALLLGAKLPSLPQTALAMAAGLLTYGISLVFFVLALRQVGTARTGAYFSTAPFVGAALAVVLGEPAELRLLAAGLFMGAGVWLHLTERHEHEHVHEPLEHTHAHVHDEHHRHDHDQSGTNLAEPHVHAHRHAVLRHKHPHFPDAHHLHHH